MSPTPIFVLGLQRSGTTWLGNLLATHPEVAAVTAERHRGIHESIFFSHFARAWNWEEPKERAKALNAFLTSDYGQLLNLDAEEISELKGLSEPAEVFRRAMDLFAEKQGALAWVEKSPHHVKEIAEISAALPDARFVAITRDSVSLVASRLLAYGRQRPTGIARLGAIFRAVASNAYHRKLLRQWARILPDRLLMLEYSKFHESGSLGCGALLRALGLRTIPDLRPGFAPNSSFSNPKARDEALSGLERTAIEILDGVFYALPLSFLDQFRPARPSDSISFPDWVWSSDMARTDPEERPISSQKREV